MVNLPTKFHRNLSVKIGVILSTGSHNTCNEIWVKTDRSDPQVDDEHEGNSRRSFLSLEEKDKKYVMVSSHPDPDHHQNVIQIVSQIFTEINT